MPSRKYDKPTTFHLTELDREILPRAKYDLDLWMAGYFRGQAFPWQKYFYHSPQKDKCCVASIRVGKSKLISMGALHFAQFNPYIRFLNTSISSEQAKIVYQNCLELCSHPNFSHWVEHVQSSPYPLIRLVNGSELWFRSIGYDAELIRGFEFDWINVDEAGYIPREQPIKTLKGRLLGFNTRTNQYRKGLFTIVSSPKGQGWLAERFKKGDPSYQFAEPTKYLSLRVSIWDNPTLSQDQIHEIMADYSEAMIRQEFYGEFLSNQDAVFPYQEVMAGCDIVHREVKWLNEQIDRWQKAHEGRSDNVYKLAGLSEDITHYECEPEAGHRYVNSWDFGKKPTSKGRNAMVGMVFDVTHDPWVMTAFFYREGMSYVEAKLMVESWHEKYSSRGATCKTAIDATGKGDVIQEFMESERTVDKLEGIVYSGANKPNLIHAGKLAIERGQLRYPFIRKLVDQLANYEIFDKDIAQDIVMTLCQACYVARQLMGFTEKPHLQRALNSMPQYSSRLPQVRLLNPRYVESRQARRGGSGGGHLRRNGDRRILRRS